ncbi:MAG: hypothetical protein QXG03_05665 [Halalkalicoccus sp.]
MGRREEELTGEDKRFLSIAVPASAFVAGLCCFTPVVTVLLGLGSVSYAIALTDLLYYQYAWAFRLAGLSVLLLALGIYLYRSEGVCSLDAARRKRRRIVNLVAISVALAGLAYILWLYVIVELAGLALGIW